MSSSILDLSTRPFCPDETASSHDVRPLKPSPATPTGRRMQAFENQTPTDRASSRSATQRDFPERESRGTTHAKGISNNGNGLASPSITPPSAYNNQPSRTRPHPSSLTPSGRHQREVYIARDSWGAPPISPCASVTHPSTVSTIDYLLQSAASASPYSCHSSPSPSPSSTDSSPSPSPPPHGRLHFPSHPELPTSASASASLLSPAEQTALTSLFTLRTSTHTHTHHPDVPPKRGHPLSPTNALSSLPPSHAQKLSCALSLLALRAHCLREEERRYRRLLVARNLCGDEDLYSDAETVVDEEERGGYGEGEKRVRVVESLEARARTRARGGDAVALRQRREKVVKRGGMGAGKGKTGGEGDAQRDLDEARKRLNVRGRKAIRAPRTGKGMRVGKKGGMVGVEVERSRWTVQALGYRRERRRKRAGTGARS